MFDDCNDYEGKCLAMEYEITGAEDDQDEYEPDGKKCRCDQPDNYCPFNATCGSDCRNHCGVGADE